MNEPIVDAFALVDGAMNDLLWIFVSALLINNFVLAYFLGLCPFLGVSQRLDTAFRLGLANIFVMLITALCAWFLNTYILPHAPYLRLISFIVVIASTATGARWRATRRAVAPLEEKETMTRAPMSVAILQAARALPPPGSLRPKTCATLFGLLYTTGLRCGEAFALNLSEVNLAERVLFIQKGKFGKSRWVPISASTAGALERYLEERRERMVRTLIEGRGVRDPSVLAAAELCGIDAVFTVGGAQAIAACAFGTESVPEVDKIFGPGNAWVTSAKSQVSADAHGAAIDMPAGPSEVLVLADDSASAEFVASDLLSQAEHGTDSQVILVTTSATLANAVATEVERGPGVFERTVELPADWDVVIVDPPRVGLGAEATGLLSELRPGVIASVSCDVASFARDASALTAAGYVLEWVQPVDMFPQTPHIETVSRFTLAR